MASFRGAATVGGGAGHGVPLKIGYSLFAIRYSQKAQAAIDASRRYAFGKVEPVSERGT